MARIGKTDTSIPDHGPIAIQCDEKRAISLFNQFFLLVAVLIGLNPALVLAAGQPPAQSISGTVEKLCPELDDMNMSGQLNAAQQDLLARCGEVKIRENENQSSFDDLSGEQKNALEWMTSTQNSTMSRVTVEFAGPQVATITGRMQTIRAGRAGGLALQMNTDMPEPVLYAGPVTSVPTDSSIWNEGRLGIFLNGSLGTGSRDMTVNEPGFDFDAYSLTTGVDYRFTDYLVLGAALGYANAKADIDDGGGDVETDGYGAALYGTYYFGQLYLDVIGIYGSKDYDIVRNVNYSVASRNPPPATTQVSQSFEGDPDATESGVAGGVGYNFAIGSLTVQPYGRLQYLRTEIDDYTESSQSGNTDAGFGLALHIDEQNLTSFTSALGAQVSYSIPTGVGVFIPEISFDWQHEFENDVRNIHAQFVNGTSSATNSILIPTDEPDRDYFGLGLGVSAVFPRGISAFAHYDTLLDLDEVTSHQVILGVRFEL